MAGGCAWTWELLMNVAPHEGFFRFLVASTSRPGHQHLVDLSEFGGIGRCSCEEWTYRISPRITGGEVPVDLFDPLFTCTHLRAAREYLFDEMFWRLMAIEPAQPQTT
jgi:hypothetical protein